MSIRNQHFIRTLLGGDPGKAYALCARDNVDNCERFLKNILIFSYSLTYVRGPVTWYVVYYDVTSEDFWRTIASNETLVIIGL
jgi:hypothetical protein